MISILGIEREFSNLLAVQRIRVNGDRVVATVLTVADVNREPEGIRRHVEAGDDVILIGHFDRLRLQARDHLKQRPDLLKFSHVSFLSINYRLPFNSTMANFQLQAIRQY